MIKLLLVPALLFAAAACTETVPPADPVPTTGSDDAPVPSETPDSPPPDAPEASLSVGILQEPNACEDSSVRLEALVFENGERVFDVNCRFTLADGRTFDGCFVTPSLPEGQLVTLTVTDPVTGASGSYQEAISGPPSFDATLEVTPLDHAIAWNVTTNFGPDRVFIDFDPIQTVVIPDPQIQQDPFGVVQVTQLGSYTVTADAYFDYGDLTCSKHLTKTVTVFCDGSAHH